MSTSARILTARAPSRPLVRRTARGTASRSPGPSLDVTASDDLRDRVSAGLPGGAGARGRRARPPQVPAGPGSPARRLTSCRTSRRTTPSWETVLEDHDRGDPDPPVVVAAIYRRTDHTCGGLDCRRRGGRVAPVTGLALNSPWSDLQGKPLMRGAVTWLLARPVQGAAVPSPGGGRDRTVYGDSLHDSANGEWESSTWTSSRSPGFPVTVALAQRRTAWARPAAPRARRSASRRWCCARTRPLLEDLSDATDRADTVLDVSQIARWAGCLGGARSSLSDHPTPATTRSCPARSCAARPTSGSTAGRPRTR